MRPLWNLLFNKGWGSGQWCGANAVEKVIQAADPAAVLALGDKQYDDGRLKASSSRTRGTGAAARPDRCRPGSHEYHVSHTANGYFTYFGARGPDTARLVHRARRRLATDHAQLQLRLRPMRSGEPSVDLAAGGPQPQAGPVHGRDHASTR